MSTTACSQYVSVVQRRWELFSGELRALMNEAMRTARVESEKETVKTVVSRLATQVRLELNKLPDDKEKEKMFKFWEPVLKRICNSYGVRV